jgi:hypothetical protein
MITLLKSAGGISKNPWRIEGNYKTNN